MLSCKVPVRSDNAEPMTSTVTTTSVAFMTFHDPNLSMLLLLLLLLLMMMMMMMMVMVMVMVMTLMV